ncbi:ataxin-10-like [Abrus precatorius]|uniref:Ataxin-10-like n=1 Tax=Abrus precatorius TaxID=3816 RepID=A0A8B8K3W1_ABRPR|nr:ataxin-10-like [Abrus precatorius]
MGCDAQFLKYPVLEDTLQLLFQVSNSSTLEESLEILIQNAKYDSGRLDLASKRVLPAVLNIVHSLTHASHNHHHHHHDVLSLCFKLLRNLCAGEPANQGSFLELNGVVLVSSVLKSEVGSSGPDHGLLRWGLQVLANVSLAGKQHQRAIWEELYLLGFVSLARLGSKEICDPLCMVIYTCCDGRPEWFSKLSSDDDNWLVIEEIVRTAASAGSDEDWLKLLLSRICLEESQLPVLFSKLWFVDTPEGEVAESRDDQFSSEQAFLLLILSEILNEQLRDVTVSNDVALFVFGILKKSIGVLEHAIRGNSGLPSGSAAIDVLGYSITILRDICAQNVRGNKEDAKDFVDVLLPFGLIELLLSLLGDLEPPAIIRKGIKQFENENGARCSSKPCPYKGFRRDVVALIGNCVYRTKHAQDEIRQKNGILLLLQQCVTDEDNRFLREWGIWCVRNMLEGNEENQKVVAELELQGSADVPEIAALGLRVEVDQRTRRAKLVNIP